MRSLREIGADQRPLPMELHEKRKMFGDRHFVLINGGEHQCFYNSLLATTCLLNTRGYVEAPLGGFKYASIRDLAFVRYGIANVLAANPQWAVQESESPTLWNDRVHNTRDEDFFKAANAGASLDPARVAGNPHC